MNSVRGYPVQGRIGALCALAIVLTVPMSAPAQRTEPLPEELRDVGITEKLDNQVPLDLEFKDTDGNEVTLAEYFDGERPVVLTMNYSNCPMLCSLQLNGLFDALERLQWDVGDRFQMMTVSIDPLETTERARATRQNYLKMYRRPGAAQGYHCLTGREKDIKALAEAVGFRYAYEPETREYLHAAATMILTPDGRVSQYLYGVEYDPQTIRFSLLDASEGKIGTTTDQILMFCFQYDAAKGRYAPHAFRLMRVGGGLTVLVLFSSIWILRRREKKTARAEDKQTEEAP